MSGAACATSTSTSRERATSRELVTYAKGVQGAVAEELAADLPAFSLDIVAIIAAYAAEQAKIAALFDQDKWYEHAKVDVPPAVFTIDTAREIAQFLKRPDPIDQMNGHRPARAVEDIWHAGVYRPERMTLRKLRELFPQFFQFVNEQVMQFHGNKALGGRIVFIRGEDVECRNKAWSEMTQRIREVNAKTGAGLEEEPDLVDIAVALCGIRASTGKCPLGDVKGEERRITFSRTKQTIAKDELTPSRSEIHGKEGAHVDIGAQGDKGMTIAIRWDKTSSCVGIKPVKIFTVE